MKGPMMRTSLPLHPRHGVHAPTEGTPARRPGSLRRTSTVDALRPAPLEQQLILIGSMRDLLTPKSGAASVLAEARSRTEIHDTDCGPFVTSVATWPAVDGVGGLVGLRAGRGFRGGIDARTSARPGTGEYLLLDEVPMCTLVSGYAVMHAGARGNHARLSVPRSKRNGAVHGVDACAGFTTGGTIMTAMAAGENAVATGPEALSVLDPDDALAWHELPAEQPADAVRRWRRTDVWRDEGGRWLIDSFYRDSHMAPDGLETVIHEYTVEAAVDGQTMTVLECSSTPRVLPFVECLPAAGSATRLAGLQLGELRSLVRSTFTGASTCTHLNDQLRGLADVEPLVQMLIARA